MSSSVLPPRKRDWSKGNVQIGLFIRFPNGETMEATINSASDGLAGDATKLLSAMCQKGATKP